MDASESVHPEVLEEKTPELLAYVFQQAQNFCSAYGWYVLGMAVIMAYIWNQYLDSVYRKWLQDRDDKIYAAKYHKNPDIFRVQQEAVEAARRRMQEEHDEQAKIHTEKSKQREELKREEWLSRQVGSQKSGQRLGSAATHGETVQSKGSSSKKSLSSKPEFFPLMGASGSGQFRAAKRGCPGGGCGKK